jgi:hypothetical protein
MPSNERRAAARRRAWGRGPIILRFEPLEGRQLLTLGALRSLPDMAGTSFHTSVQNADWGDQFAVSGTIINQGETAVPKAFDVEVLASSTPTPGPTSVDLGDFTVPALQPGQTATYNQQVALPPTPIPGFTGSPIYISTLINPGRTVTESNYHNDSGVGLQNDTAILSITPKPPSNLVGSSFTISPNQVQWGQAVTVTAQIHNDAPGDAPATRAALILTPSGVAPGNGQDVTIGYLNVPAVPAWQTVNVVQTITLPASPPALLSNGASFTISMIQDADYIANTLFPHLPTQGAGLDSTQISIGLGSNTPTNSGPLPDLAAGGIQAPTTAIHWGQTFQISAGIQNVGQGNAGAFDVKFFLTGASGALTPAIYLGDEPVSGLAAGASQVLIPNLTIPGRLPSGLALNSLGIGRIVMEIDVEHVVSETNLQNNTSVSNPVTLRLLGTNGTSNVPTSAPAGVSLGQPQTQGTLNSTNGSNSPESIRAARHAATRQMLRLHSHATPKKQSLTDKVVNNLKVFPKHLDQTFKDLFHV